MKLSQFSVKNSLFVNLIAVFFVIAGLIAVFNIRREAFPNINFDIVVIRTPYAGSTPKEIEKLIILPIEAELREVDDIQDVSSVAIEGMALTILKIDEDAPNPDKAVNDIQRAVDRVSDLPQDLEERPVVEQVSTRDNPTIEVSLSGGLEEEILRQYAKQLETLLLDIPGVASIAKKGWRDPEVWVSVDPHKVESYYLSLSDIITALARRNVSIPGGSIYEGKKEIIVRTTGEFETAEEIQEVIIRANEEGHWVQVKDVAHVQETFAEETTISKTLGTRAINLVVIKKASGDTIHVVKKVKEVVGQFQKKADEKLKISYVNDISYYTQRRLNVLLSNGWIGMILILVMLLVFLSRRTAASAAIGIPVAILSSLTLIYYLGYSINLLSMFGLIMVLGMLVDEDIVIAENIHRHIEKHEDTKEAVVKGASEISTAVIATVMTTICAFLPLLFMKGIMGKFIKIIPIVVILTLVASLLEALIILPSHLYDLHRLQKNPESKKAPREYKWYRSFLNWYLCLVPKAMKHRYKVAGGVLLLTIGSILFAIFVMPFSLFPSKGIEFFFIRGDAAIGTPIEETSRLFVPLEKIVAGLPKDELDTFVTQVGLTQNDPDDPFTNRGSHIGQMAVYLTPESRRDRTAEDIIVDLRQKSEGQHAFEKIYFERVKPGPPVGKAVAIRVMGDEYPILEKISEDIANTLKNLPGVQDVKDDYEIGKTEMMIVVDEKAATQAGLTIAEIARTIRQAYEGEVATIIRKGEEEIAVRVRMPIEEREDQESLSKVLIPNRFGKLVPLTAVAKTERRPGLSAIKHYNYKRAITVGAEVDGRKATSVSTNRAIEKKFGKTIEEYPGTTIQYGGEQEETTESVRHMLFSFFLALILIFTVLVVVFRSLIQSAIIMTTIPFSIIGVTIALFAHGEPFSFMVLLGLVGLTGIVVDNAIILISFINEERRRGKELTEAIMESCKVRFRPVILVSLTTIAGVLPSAYGIGGNDPFIRPMALTLNWGLFFGTVLTLIVIPCLYLITEDLKNTWESLKKKITSNFLGRGTIRRKEEGD